MAATKKRKSGKAPSKTGSRARTRPESGLAIPVGDRPQSEKTSNIRVRMYRVGFGDCFLLSLPKNEAMAHVLIDCGVHSRGDLGTMQDIVANIASETGKHLDLIIATHVHQDHISGFAKCEEQFKEFTVGEVWMPWTENPRDAEATKLKRKHVALAEKLRQHMQAKGFRLDNTVAGEALAAVMNAADNPTAMALLKSGVRGGQVRYVTAGDSFNDAAGIEGLAAQILGPPRDKKFLSRMDPPKGDRFLRLDQNGDITADDAVLPFLDKWIADPKSWRDLVTLSASDKKMLEDVLDNATGIAFALDQVLNNTSIVTLLTYRGKNLLFPGDAQYGNWESWMNSSEAGAIFENVHFFKVAHHGSHNATPKSALEKMRDGFAAMISTQNVPWPSIPFKKMLDRLEEKAAGVVRSDSIAIANAGKKIPKGPSLNLKPDSGFRIGPFWCDYTLAQN